MAGNKQRVFQVNLKGMISLLSEHIYSNPGTFVRELLQNGTDAITAFLNINEFLEGKIQIILRADGSIVFEDNGIGLTEDEIHQVLTVIGESSKREGSDANDFIGRFGIGLLSCFVVSNEIVFETRSAKSKDAIRWCGKADGTYETILLEEELPIGTRVILRAKPEWRHLFEYDTLKRNLSFYGNALPYHIFISQGDNNEQINDLNPIWLSPGASREELLEYGRKTFQSSFLDVFQVRTENGGISGSIYILPFKTQFSGKLTHRIYLKRMLLGEDNCNLLPSWAFFVKCVLNADTLSSTASRESLVNNEELRRTQKEIGHALKDYLKNLIYTNNELFNQILDIHYLHIKAIAVEDSDMFGLFMDTLPFETNKGNRSFGSIRKNNGVVYYTPSLDDFKQMRRIAHSQGMLVINAAYTFDESLLKKASRFFPEIELEEISPARILDIFTDAEYSRNPSYRTFEERCNKQLQSFGCICKLKHFTPVDMPVIFVASEKVTTQKAKANPLNDVLGAFSKKTNASMPTLCMNLDNELVKTLIRLEHAPAFESILNILYVQALLLGKYPVNNDEMILFNESLNRLVITGMADLLKNIQMN